MSSLTILLIIIAIIAVLFLVLNFLLAPHNPFFLFRKINFRDKLSNSGKSLKLFILNCILKYTNGLVNHWCIVTIKKMIEREIGNRGSKSVVVKTAAVKEQRVNGSCNGQNPLLRCTLGGFERNYQVNSISNLIKRNYSQFNFRFNPWYITGFVDGEGSFMLTIIKDKKYKLGWRIVCRFIISLNKKDLALLNSIKDFFGVGTIFLLGKDSIQYRVESWNDVGVIINHFVQYPLITKKHADFLLFKSAYNLIINKSHLTEKGLMELIAIKAVMNRGLSDDLKLAFPNLVPCLRPEVPLVKISDFHWLAGFTEAEGCFSVVLFKSPTSKYGLGVKLSFILTQHIRDEDLIKSLVEYLGCGNISFNRDTINFKVASFVSLKNVIVPFFIKYSLHGKKRLDFDLFNEVVKLMENKEHLTKEGLSKIEQIKNEMNSKRK
nr:hypothetical protein [Ceratocystis fimbriata]WPM94756.1 hypothetical protein [Ceratocystis fimbriata]